MGFLCLKESIESLRDSLNSNALICIASPVHLLFLCSLCGSPRTRITSGSKLRGAEKLVADDIMVKRAHVKSYLFDLGSKKERLESDTKVAVMVVEF